MRPLTDDIVREILAAPAKLPTHRLAKRLGVAMHACREARAGRTWAHVDTETPRRRRPQTRKLTPLIVRNCRWLVSIGMSGIDTAACLGLAPCQVSEIRRGAHPLCRGAERLRDVVAAERRALIVRMYRDGLRQVDICRELRTSRSEVVRALDKEGVVFRRREREVVA